MTNCGGCGAPMRIIPAGVSKTTGKPYSEFQACSAKCGWKPQTNAPVNPIYQEYKQAQPKKEEPNWDKISLGKCKTLFLVESYKKGESLADAEPKAEAWAKASMRILDDVFIEEPPFPEF